MRTRPRRGYTREVAANSGEQRPTAGPPRPRHPRIPFCFSYLINAFAAQEVPKTPRVVGAKRAPARRARRGVAHGARLAAKPLNLLLPSSPL